MYPAKSPLRHSADEKPHLAVIHTNHVSYLNGRPATLRALEMGRWGIATYDNADHRWHVILAFETRGEADNALYQLVITSDDLMKVETCHACYDILDDLHAPIRHGDIAYCSIGCEQRRPLVDIDLRWFRLAVLAGMGLTIWALSLGWVDSALSVVGVR